MFCKSTSLFFLTLLSVFSVTSAHAGVSPALGVAGGTLKRSDVKRPSKANPCGQGVNIASVLDTSTAVPAGGNGEVPVTAINFNPGGDGSRKVSAKVDSKGSGTNFVVMDVTVNGDAVCHFSGTTRSGKGSQQIVFVHSSWLVTKGENQPSKYCGSASSWYNVHWGHDAK